MEILAAVGVAIIAFMLFMFARFVGFKKRLMQAFDRHGVPYHIANEAYSHAADFINSMNADGRPVDDIVLETMRRYPELF